MSWKTCKSCDKPNITRKVTFLGFSRYRCQSCGYVTFGRLSTIREVIYTVLLLLLTLSVVLHCSEIPPGTAITTSVVFSPFIILILLLIVGLALLNNIVLISRGGIQNPQFWVRASIYIIGLIGGLFWYARSGEETQSQLDILIMDQRVDWHLFQSDAPPVEITLHLKNKANHSVEGEIVFSLILDNDKLGQQLFDFAKSHHLLEGISIDGDNNSSFAIAIKNYQDRGMRFEDGLEYEPLINTALQPEIFHFSTEVRMDSMNVQKTTIYVDVPLEYRVYRGVIKIVEIQD